MNDIQIIEDIIHTNICLYYRDKIRWSANPFNKSAGEIWI